MLQSNQHLVSPALTIIYMIGAFIGAFSCVYLMQMSGQSVADRMDPGWLRRLRRCGYTSVALSLLYGANFVAKEDTAPWLPNVMLVWAVSLSLAVAIIAVRRRAPASHALIRAGIVNPE